MRTQTRLSTALLVLGAGVAITAVLGPLLTGSLRYRTSDTALNQISGGDLATLFVVMPMCLVVASLARAGHPAAPALALAPAVYSIYMYSQLIIGNEYTDLPGNVERFFPLLLGNVLVGAWVSSLAWSALARQVLPSTSKRYDQVVGLVLLGVAAYVVLGIHLGSYLDAVSSEPSRAEYLDAPTAFWAVKLWDLAVVVPAAVVIGVGMLRRRAWARAPMYALLGGYLLLACAVCGMAWVMQLEGDPAGSLVQALASTGVVGLLGVAAARLYRPLFAVAPEKELVT